MPVWLILLLFVLTLSFSRFTGSSLWTFHLQIPHQSPSPPFSTVRPLSPCPRPPSAANYGAPSSTSAFASCPTDRVDAPSQIKSMSFRKRQIGYFLEFFDYPDEKTRWTKLYQKPLQQPDQALEEGKLELMVRPPFPPFFRKSQPPKFCPTSDVIAITNDTWKVGDLVDWWYDSCYWSGRVSELLKDDHIKEHGNFDSCAILIHRNSYETINTRMSMPCDSSLEGKPNCSYTATEELSNTSSVPTEASYTDDQASATDSVRKIHISGSDRVISTKDDVSIGRKQPSARDHLNSLGKIWIDETNYTASLKHPPDSIESSIIQLEVLAQKIKWLKGLQKFRFQWSSATKSSWKFVENNTFLK
ncbi:uncharacterized protein LOC135637704 isoform X2 [Musa acuminata AAA Group]|uniref:uncharacterized protein LOC135584149 isoform X2 n=1 Tax=Musa acuminata AAA Group TaxID=214697 RepID=UPI0031DB829C